jgi:hypothetical protein
VAIPEGLSAQLWVLATAIGAPLVLGAGIVRALGLPFRAGRRAFVAYAYLAGQLAQAGVTFAWLAAQKPVPGVILPILACAGGALLLALAHRRRPPPLPRSAPDLRMGLAALVCAVFVVDTSLCVNVAPIVVGDEADIWTAKARVLYTAPDFGIGFGLHFHVSHADYPLLNPLVQVLAFAGSGRVLLAESRLPIQAFAVCLVLLLSVAVRARTSLPVALAAVCAFTGSLFLTAGAVAYADVMLAFAMLAAAHGWLRFCESGGAVHWRLTCLALAAAIATKNEGTMLVLAFLLATGLAWAVRERERGTAPEVDVAPPRWRALSWLGLPLATLLLGAWFNRHFGLVNDLLDPNLGNGMGLLERALHHLADRIVTVARFYGGLLVGADGRWLVMLCLAAAAVFAHRRWREPVYGLVAFVAAGLLGYVLVFVGTPRPLEWHLLTAADRTVLHVMPVATLALAALIGRGAAAGAAAPGLSAPAQTTSGC